MAAYGCFAAACWALASTLRVIFAQSGGYLTNTAVEWILATAAIVHEIMLLVCVAILAWVGRRPARDVLWLHRVSAEQVLWASLLVIATLPWNTLIHLEHLSAWSPPLMIVMLAVTVGPILEELFFRSCVFSAFSRRPIVGMCVSIVLFSSYHYMGSLTSVARIVPVATVMALAFVLVRSVYPVILGHMLANLIVALGETTIATYVPPLILLLLPIPIIVLCACRLYYLREPAPEPQPGCAEAEPERAVSDKQS